VFEQSESYKAYEPLSKAQTKMNLDDLASQPCKTDPKKPKTDININ